MGTILALACAIPEGEMHVPEELRMVLDREDLRWTVLLVEDAAVTRDLISKHLDRVGFRVTAVGEAEAVAAVREANGRPFDVVVSDVHLPGMSGIELASLLLAATPAQPIVLITGDPDAALALEALSRGPVKYLLKPFQLSELETVIRNTLVTHFQRKQNPPASKKPSSTVGAIPTEWLRWVDERSYAGAGHARRVARVCAVLTAALPEVELDQYELDIAAHAHELGLMSGVVSDPVELAWRGADLLSDLGSPFSVVKTVRHLHERWDGTGGPDQLRGLAIPVGARVLSVADAIDHYTAAWVQAGIDPMEAVDRAIGLVLVQQETLFSPMVVGAASHEWVLIRSICGVARPAAAPQEIPRKASRTYPMIATALLGRLS